MPEFRERGIPAFLMALNGILGKTQKVYFLDYPNWLYITCIHYTFILQKSQENNCILGCFCQKIFRTKKYIFWDRPP